MRAFVFVIAAALALLLGWQLAGDTEATLERDRAAHGVPSAEQRDATDAASSPDPAITEPGAAEDGDPEPSIEERAEAFVARMRAARGGARFPELMAIATEMARIEPPRVGLAILKRAFALLADDQRAGIALLKGFNREKHTFVLNALQLGDAVPQMRATVNAYRIKYAFDSFLDDEVGLRMWNERYGHLSLAEAWPRSAADFVARLKSASPDEVKEMLGAIYSAIFVTEIDEMRRLGVTQAMVDGGLAAVARRLFDEPVLRSERAKLLAMVLAVDPSDEAAKKLVLPLLENPAAHDSNILGAAARALGRPDRPWAAPTLVNALKQIGYEQSLTTALAEALAKCNPRGAIPQLTDVLAANDTDQMRMSLGFVLEQLTGVRRSRKHGAQFWTRWWSENGRAFADGESPK